MKTNGAFIYVKMKNGAHIYNLFEDSFFFHKIKKILLQIGGGGGGVFFFFFFLIQFMVSSTYSSYCKRNFWKKDLLFFYRLGPHKHSENIALRIIQK